SDSNESDSSSGVPFDVKSIARMTRAIAIVMIIFYCGYFLFCFQTYRISASDEFKKHRRQTINSINYPRGFSPKRMISSMFTRKGPDTEEELRETPQQDNETPRLREEPKANLVVAGIVTVACTVLIVFTTQYLWQALDSLMWNSEEDRYRISPKFVGIILIQLVTHLSQVVYLIEAMNDSIQDRLDDIIDTVCVYTLTLIETSLIPTPCTSHRKMIGGSIQMSLFITPLMVIIGWIIGIPLLLINDPLDCVVLFLSVLVLNYVVNDGRSNWFEGVILLTLYIIFAISLWYYPGRDLFIALEGLGPLPKICGFDGN
ncbi:unnamed protein product, partial [Rhizoctonia solani]